MARYGITASAVGEPGLSDQRLYRDLLDDVDFCAGLGFTSVWMIEHHFSDYFPTPDPIVMLSHIAARHPELALGTAVLVTPWYDPRRLAEDIAMLANLTTENLYLGLGRGTAKNEFDTFELNLSDSSAMFEESVALLRAALFQNEFTFKGRFYNVEKPVSLRPRVDDPSRIHLFGALGTPTSGDKMARIGLAPLARVMGTVDRHVDIVNGFHESWRTHQPHAPMPDEFPIMITAIIEDTMDEAMDQAKVYVPMYMKQQLDRYTPDELDWEQLPDYKSWIPQFNSMRHLSNPDNVPEWAAGNFVGPPEHVAGMLQGYLDAGFNNFIVQTATPGVPVVERRRWWSRFATEVLPQVKDRASAS
jgi:alkanesulfonate monooxygenase SsuD/methylene tetrahydromethanopterin reductase-like flavin-dependent oxidoreductase (luciferase family)